MSTLVSEQLLTPGTYRIVRFPDWESLLDSFFQSRLNAPFQLGLNDCAMFACDAIKAITGVDLVMSLRGKYSSMKQGHDLIDDLTEGKGMLHFYDVTAKQYNIKDVPLLLAHRGDAVIITLEEGPVLGVIGLDGMYACFAGPDGIEKVLVRDCDKAWSIG